MAFDFPNTPTTNQIATMPDGTVRRWDGTKWVAGQSPTGPYCFIGDTPPSSPTPGVTWWDSVGCQLFVYYNDGNSSQWVPAVAVPASVGEAPSNSNFYARQNGQWANIGASQLQGNVGRNLLHNSLFNIQQRGPGPFAGGYTLDRWVMSAILDTCAINRVLLTDGDRAGITEEAAIFALQNTFTGNAGATSNSYLEQRMEGVRRLGGKTVTISFWANCAPNMKLGVNIAQLFGTGGSPSASVFAIATGIALSVTAIWTRYFVTIPIPSTSGKTLGTNNDDMTLLRLYYSSGANGNQAAGNIGVQSGTLNIWGMQLEVGTVATQLEKIEPRMDLANCQRFYQTGVAYIEGYGSASVGLGYTLPFAVAMRAVPTVTLSGIGYANGSGAGVIGQTNTGFSFRFLSTGVGGAYATANYSATADL